LADGRGTNWIKSHIINNICSAQIKSKKNALSQHKSKTALSIYQHKSKTALSIYH
jgi:hypothetical protein